MYVMFNFLSCQFDTPQKSNIDTKQLPFFLKELSTFSKPSILGIHVSFQGCTSTQKPPAAEDSERFPQNLRP